MSIAIANYRQDEDHSWTVSVEGQIFKKLLKNY